MIDKMEIKLKECCLTCEHFSLRTDVLNVCGARSNDKREISCIHMPVCKEYNENTEITDTNSRLNNGLKRCPFCGGEVDIVRATTHKAFWVKCQNVECGVESPAECSEEEAIAAWNHRVYDD